jgi:hypothetical protein
MTASWSGSPKTWVDQETPSALEFNTEFRDRFDFLSVHSHTGANGDGSATLDSLDHMDLDEGGALSAPAASHTRFAANTDGTLRYYPNGGSEKTVADTDHEHTISEVQVVTDTQVDISTPAVISGGTGIGTSWTTIESVSITVGGTGERAVICSGSVSMANGTGLSDGHTGQVRLEFDSTEVEITAWSAQIDNGEEVVVHISALVSDVASGAKTLNLQCRKSGGTGDLVAWHYGAAALEAQVTAP